MNKRPFLVTALTLAAALTLTSQAQAQTIKLAVLQELSGVCWREGVVATAAEATRQVRVRQAGVQADDRTEGRRINAQNRIVDRWRE